MISARPQTPTAAAPRSGLLSPSWTASKGSRKELYIRSWSRASAVLTSTGGRRIAATPMTVRRGGELFQPDAHYDRALRSSRRRLVGDGDIVSRKHQAREFIAMASSQKTLAPIVPNPAVDICAGKQRQFRIVILSKWWPWKKATMNRITEYPARTEITSRKQSS